MAYSSYVNEDGTRTYFDIDDPTKTYASPPTDQKQQTLADNPSIYADGSQRYFDPNDANDLANARQNYKELMAHPEWSDAQVKQYIAQNLNGQQLQFGSNGPGLTSKVDNAKQGYDTWAPLLIGGLATAGAAGWLGGAAGGLDAVGAGATEFGGETALQGSSYLSPGGGALDFTAGGSGASLPNGGGVDSSLSELSNTNPSGSPYAPDAPVNGNPYTTPNSPPVDLNGNPIGNVDEFGNPISSDTLGTQPINPSSLNPQSLSQLQQMAKGGSSLASRLLSGQATAADWLQGATALGTTLAGLVGADATRSANNSAADKMMALGAPARAEFNRTIQPGFDPSTMPGYTSAIDSVMNSYLRKASTGGNPFSNPGVSMEANKYVTDSTALPAVNNYRNTLVAAGNTGVGNAAAPNLAAASAPNQATNAVAGGLGALSAQPAQDYSQVLKQILNLGQTPP